MKKAFKIIGKGILGIIVLVLLLFAFVYFTYNEPLPKGVSGPEADALATKILNAVQHEQYKNTRYLSWTFRDAHHYIWDKDQQKVEVSWDTVKVNLNLKEPKMSIVSVDGTKTTPENASKYIEKALAYFHNDSFWVVAPHKVFDKGVTRSIVSLEDNETGLLVTYKSGGTTPGDSYLWLLDKNYRPKAYKMWVSIIPIGGLYVTWDNWQPTKSGITLPTAHSMFILNIPIKDAKAWN
ncbi:hypothetical protein [uncultured Kordia sp.]|uniref:hypothetical protein n=1 Tax=uncultured Kordia sp. TaxID=507699 RepID=UPI00261D9C50|nr:hypothetical protein [uncultured Kordia sp.]